ncbi:DUF3021 family protein [Acetobacterium woodii]|uniref:DUF3021 domain-containing protein n=1 Tax=Acetobacterium woodii (strain ATCC 29683 / DSM 1030 / JCM 2381 / KCTC 1655 / WB1) TaxID=931626 RepID=H6LBY9_ACEWD|nr:DUF3021 family protein [Acetobacterium woodii]AFA47732.1 hypothetical protein Awo_c09440 [Acetobacterium woodii DSM 1030]
MKRIIRNALITTALILLTIAIWGYFLGAESIYITTVMQVALIAVAIQGIREMLKKIEIPHLMLEKTIEFLCIAALIWVSSFIFDWVASFSLKVLLMITLIVYVVFYLLDRVKTANDIEEINQLLKDSDKRK